MINTNFSLNLFIFFYALFFSLMIYNQSVFLPKDPGKIKVVNFLLVIMSFLIELFLIKLVSIDISNIEIQMLMLSWSGLGRKIVDYSRNFLITSAGTVLGGYTGSLINSRSYSYNTNREHIYGDVYIDTKNYNFYTLSLLRKLGKACEERDVERIYKFWVLIIKNPEGHLSMNYGKLNNTSQSHD